MEKKTYYTTCPNCGANLDPDEKCDCMKKEKPVFPLYPVDVPNDAEGQTVLLTEAIARENKAFYMGFIAARIETPEGYEALTSAGKLAMMAEAMERCSVLRREDTSDIEGLYSILYGKEPEGV